MINVKLLKIFFIAILLTSCSLVGTSEEEGALRSEYAQKSLGLTQSNLYTRTVLITATVGAVSQLIPGLHLLGLFFDMGAIAYYSNELIYGTGAIIARDRKCPTLIEKADYWRVLGTGIDNIKSSAEFETVIGLSTAITPFVSREKAAATFLSAIKLHGPTLVGPKVTGLVLAKVTAKGLTGIVPILGPIAASGINWYIFHRVESAALAYYEAKANHICGP